MANLFDYLIWRGDIPFSIDPFGEVDNLVLSEIAYVDFAGIVPEDGSMVSLKDASEAFFATHDRETLKAAKNFSRMAPFFMERCAATHRYSNVLLGNYINEVDHDAEKQVSAITFYPGDFSVFIAYRGTDDTLVGWREDFILSYISGTAGQQRAVEYLNRIGDASGLPIRVGGHSKGGNFAVYAAAFCKPAVRKRIREVYSNDGPGFRKDVLESKGYQEIRERTVQIVPEESLIGMLLDHDYRRVVIKSDEHTVMQHDLLSWRIYGRQAERAEELSAFSQFLNETIRHWLMDIDDETRKSFVESMFLFFDASGASTLSEVRESKLVAAVGMLAALSKLPEEKRTELKDILVSFMKTSNQTLQEEFSLMIRSGLEKIRKPDIKGTLLPQKKSEDDESPKTPEDNSGSSNN